VKAALQDTDRRVAEGKPVAPSFLLACVLWQDVRDGWAAAPGAPRARRSRRCRTPSTRCSTQRIGDVSGRGKLAADMREIWMMQPRFEKRVGSTPFGLVEQPRFRAGLTSCACAPTWARWTRCWPTGGRKFSTADDAEREDLVAQVREEKPQPPGARRVHRVPRTPVAEPGAAIVARRSAEGAADAGRCAASRQRPQKTPPPPAQARWRQAAAARCRREHARKP
jgi:poly(A) polymerase